MLKSGRGLGKRAGGTLRLALSSLSRHPLLNATHISVFAIPLCVLFVLLFLQNEVMREWRGMLPERAPNHFVLNIAEEQVDGVRRLLDANSTYQGIVFPMARGSITQVNGTATVRTATDNPMEPSMNARETEAQPSGDEEMQRERNSPRGLSRERNFSASARLPEGNELVAGEWWTDPSAMEASIDEEFAGWFGLEVGDQLDIDFDGRPVRVSISSLRKVDWGSFQPNFFLMLTPAALADVPSTHLASFHVESGDTAFVGKLLEAYPTLSILSIDQLVRRFRDILDTISTAMSLLVSLVLASAALVMLASIITSRELRMREYGLLRTLGGSSSLVRGSLLLEFAGLGVFAGLAAALATEATLFGLQEIFFEMPHQWHPMLFVYAPIVGLVLVSLLGGARQQAHDASHARHHFAGNHMRAAARLALPVVLLASAGANCEPEEIEEVRVRVSAIDLDSRDYLSGYTLIDQDALERTRHTHPNELFVRVPGLWISRGSGQEHLTALRSGVLTGAGACAGVLFLEDGVPIRPQGFCNVNNLFEATLELSDMVEVLRGPAVASFRGNPLYGAVNGMSLASDDASWLELEVGSEQFRGLKASSSAELGRHALRASVKLAATDGFRDSVGHREQKVKLIDRARINDWDSLTSFALSNLDQQTGGYVLGGNAYKSSELRRSNPNPEAYREAWSARLVSHWRRRIAQTSEVALVPYARASRMRFLQHFFAGTTDGIQWPHERRGDRQLAAPDRYLANIARGAVGICRCVARANPRRAHNRLRVSRGDTAHGKPLRF